MKTTSNLKKLFSSKGFTLIELLIVIAILGILAAGVVVVIDPITKINSANLAKAETFDASIQNSLSIDLAGEWTFDDGTAKDTSGYGNITTLYNGATVTATDRKGQANKALTLNGVSAYVNVGAGPSLDITSAITIEAWVYYTGSTDFPRIVVKGGEEYGLWKDYTRWTFQIEKGGVSANAQTAPNTVQNNVWTHLAGTFDGTNIKIYMNGTLRATTNSSGTIDSVPAEAVYIGTSPPFQGIIDDVRIYKSALLSFQVQQLFAQGLVKHLLADRLSFLTY